METRTITATDFRRNFASTLNRADAGETIRFSRHGRKYTLFSEENDDTPKMTPELWKRIAEAEEDVRNGNCITLRTREDIDRFVDSLLV